MVLSSCYLLNLYSFALSLYLNFMGGIINNLILNSKNSFIRAMNLLRKLALMTASTALGLTGISVTSAQAASLFVSGGFTVGGFRELQSSAINGTLSGSFSGIDSTGSGFLTTNELDSFEMTYSGDPIIGTQTWSLANLRQFSYLYLNNGIPKRFTLSAGPNNNGSNASISVAEGAFSSVSSPTASATSISFPSLGSSVTVVPEPDNIGAVFVGGTILGLGLLFKKKSALLSKSSVPKIFKSSFH